MKLIQAPIKNPKIRSDGMGDGHFMSPRGDRLHKGIDLEVTLGEEIYSPVDGQFVRIAHPYASTTKWRGVYIHGEHYWIKIFYMYPIEELVGYNLEKGQHIGIAQNISEKYGSQMKAHIHFEVAIPPTQSMSHDGRVFGNEIYINPEPLIL